MEDKVHWYDNEEAQIVQKICWRLVQWQLIRTKNRKTCTANDRHFLNSSQNFDSRNEYAVRLAAYTRLTERETNEAKKIMQNYVTGNNSIVSTRTEILLAIFNVNISSFEWSVLVSIIRSLFFFHYCNCFSAFAAVRKTHETGVNSHRERKMSWLNESRATVLCWCCVARIGADTRTQLISHDKSKRIAHVLNYFFCTLFSYAVFGIFICFRPKSIDIFRLYCKII